MRERERCPPEGLAVGAESAQPAATPLMRIRVIKGRTKGTEESEDGPKEGLYTTRRRGEREAEDLRCRRPVVERREGWPGELAGTRSAVRLAQERKSSRDHRVRDLDQHLGDLVLEPRPPALLASNLLRLILRELLDLAQEAGYEIGLSRTN